MIGESKSLLPSTWVRVKLADVYTLCGGGTPSTANAAYWSGDIPWITSADIEGVKQINVRRRVSELGIVHSATNKVPAGALLVATRVGLGKVAIADEPICFSQDVQALVQSPDLVCPTYTLYLLSFTLQALKFEGRGTTISGFTKLQLAETPFPLPPLNEQRRIVAKLEELFSELDAGVESLKTAREQLKVYRQALLKHAFEGKLTAAWRAENADKLESAEELLECISVERSERHRRQLAEWESAVRNWQANGKQGRKPSKPSAPKQLSPLTPDELAQLPELPHGWAWDRLGWMTCSVEYGTSAKSTKTGSHPVIRMGNVQYGKLDWSDLAFTSNTDEIEQYLLRPGDVLFNRTNSPELVGKTAVYLGGRPAIFAGYLIRINQIEEIARGGYLNLFLNSHLAKQHAARVKTDGVNQSNISGGKLVAYPFPFCSPNEQDAIISLLDEKLSEVDRADQELVVGLQQAEVLRQSILKRAFAGQLVTQDSTDEPASVLLERIRAEKASAADVKRARKQRRAPKLAAKR